MNHRNSPAAVGALSAVAITLIIAWVALVAQGIDVPAMIGGITYTGGT
jgi:hypothetical protein